MAETLLIPRPGDAAAQGLITTDPACGCRDPFSEPRSTAEEIVLDTRPLSLRGGIGRTLEAAERLTFGQRLRVLSHGVDWALLAQLERFGCRYRIVKAGAGQAEVLITRFIDSAGSSDH